MLRLTSLSVLALVLATPSSAQALTQAAHRSPASGSELAPVDLRVVSNGFGKLLPHQVLALDERGLPTSVPIEVRSLETLVENVTPTNPVLPNATWPTLAVLPNGDPGNHYLVFELSRPIDVDSVLDDLPAGQANSGWLGSLVVISVDPVTGQQLLVKGRAFIGGKTYAGVPTGSPPTLDLQTWVTLQGGLPVANPAIDNDADGVPDGLGFPGTQSVSSADAERLLSPSSVVFVPDTDGDLATHETFTRSHQVYLRGATSIAAEAGGTLGEIVLASSSVGADVLAPAVQQGPFGPTSVPANGDVNVDPRTSITIQFTEPMQPASVGPLPSSAFSGISHSIALRYGPPIFETNVAFTALPSSPFDLTRWVLTPAHPFPGTGPGGPCGSFDQVDVQIFGSGLSDLAGVPGLTSTAFAFTTGAGPGIVNAPVAPDVIYALRGGANPSLSVVDLNGFGQSTGDPTFDFTYQTFPKGNSNYPNNPNLKFQGTLLQPPLQPGTCNVDGGSSGVFSLTRDHHLDDRLLRAPIVESVGEVMIGWPLDVLFHNGQDQGGCVAGGGNLCAIDGLKLVQVESSLAPFVPGNAGVVVHEVQAGGNPISWSPHPNPPGLVFPPLCVQPYIGAREPSSLRSGAPATVGGQGLSNLLVGGDPFGQPGLGIPPSGLLTPGADTHFLGPDAPGLPLSACLTNMQRQQVGHFLYAIDAVREELVVLNSNRMSVLERIQIPSPADLAMGPNLDFLAVTSRATDSLHVIDIDPRSATFHATVQVVSVGDGPRGVAWDPGGEDLFVCNELEDSVCVISAFDLQVRKTVTGFLDGPFDVVVTPRQEGFGFERGVGFAWILNRSGQLTLFETGPDGVGGLGYDDTIGVAAALFENPRALQVDPRDPRGAVVIAHETPLDAAGNPTGVVGGALSFVAIDSAVVGPLPLTSANAGTPQFRSMDLAVLASLDESVLTGVPVDVAFDDLRNLGQLPNTLSSFASGAPLPLNGKSLMRALPALGAPLAVASAPQFVFVAVPTSSEGPGVIDVLELGSASARFDTDPYQPGVQSIPVSGISGLSNYWRQ